MKKTDHHADVLIAGTGAAGLKTALTLLERCRDLKVAIAVKGRPGKCGTTANAVSDRMAFHSTLSYTPPPGQNNWRYHADDIFRIGRYVSDLPLAEILAIESEDAVRYLEDAGVPFARDKDGKLLQFLTDGSVYPRACYTGPFTAVDIERRLLKKTACYKPDVYEGCTIADILVDKKGSVCGAAGFDVKNNLHVFHSRFVVLATGGAGSIFEDNCYPSGMTGDGYALALRCGAQLVNMEFIQFGLCSKKLKAACSGSLMRAVPKITGSDGKEVLAEVYKNPSDIFRVTFKKGASWPVSYEEESKIIDIIACEKGMLYLDYTQNPSGWVPENIPEDVKNWYERKGIAVNRTLPCERLKATNPEIYSLFLKRGIDLSKEKTEVFEAAQHFQGGVKIDEWGETNVKGLFACGECAGGQHGANRPGGNALLDTQVFGKRAALKILERMNKSKTASADASCVYENYTGDFSETELKNLRRKIRKDMSRYVSVFREEKQLEKLYWDFLSFEKYLLPPGEKGRMRGIKERRAECNLKLYLEVRNSLLTALAVIKSCLERKESRGPHLFRKNGKILPSDKNYDYRYVVAGMQKGGITASLHPVNQQGGGKER